MGRECKHQWNLLDKRHITDTTNDRILYVFFCSKCLKFRKVGMSSIFEGI